MPCTSLILKIDHLSHSVDIHGSTSDAIVFTGKCPSDSDITVRIGDRSASNSVNSRVDIEDRLLLSVILLREGTTRTNRVFAHLEDEKINLTFEIVASSRIYDLICEYNRSERFLFRIDFFVDGKAVDSNFPDGSSSEYFFPTSFAVGADILSWNFSIGNAGSK